MKPNSIVKFDRVQDIPGYNWLARNKHVDVINFLHNHITDVDICLQAVEHNSAEIMVYDSAGDLIGAAGWNVKQLLGRGKDGVTFLGYRYSDANKKIKTVKCLSKYAKQYHNHTVLFSDICKKVRTKNSNIFRLHVDNNYTCYENNAPLNEVADDNLDSVLPILCRLNSWCIKHTGFAFWDFGFGSGKNYMLDSENNLKWIDYGGAGLVRCPSFESVYNKHSGLPLLELATPFGGKENLVVANSDFLMCQFLLHIEYWKNQGSTNADLWSSMLQIRRSVVDEFVVVLPRLLTCDLTQKLHSRFKHRNWTDEITWKQVGKYINENT